MVLNNFLAVVVFEIIRNLVSMRNSLNAYNCWHKQNFENCSTLLIKGIPHPGFYGGGGVGDFCESSVMGGLRPIAILGGNDLFRGISFFRGVESISCKSGNVFRSAICSCSIKTICRSFFICFLRRHSS